MRYRDKPQPLKTVGEMLADPEFWYESVQNWQSEFLSITVFLVLVSTCASAARPSQSQSALQTP